MDDEICTNIISFYSMKKRLEMKDSLCFLIYTKECAVEINLLQKGKGK